MASGIFQLTQTLNSGRYAIDGRIVWSSKSNGTKNNSSDVTAELQIRKPNKATTTGTWKGSFTVGAETATISKFLAIGEDWVTIETISTTVSHASNGNGSCYLNAVVNGPTGTTVSGSKTSGATTVTLDKIARFSTITSGEDFNDEGNPTITYSNPAGAAVTRLQACISITGENADVPYRDIPIDGTSYTFNLTENERNTLRNAAANTSTLPVKLCIRSTLDGATDSDSVTVSMRVVNAAPEVVLSVEDTNKATIALTGDPKRLIALYSVAQVTIDATPKKGATIPADGIKITHGNVVLNGDGILDPVTNNNIVFAVTDSRGYKTAGGFIGKVVPYIDPKVAVGGDIPDGNGNMTLVATGKAYHGTFGDLDNAVTIRYRYRTSSGSYPAWKAFDDVVWDGNNFTATAQITGLDYTKKYIFQAAVEDGLHAYPGVISKSVGVTAVPVFDWSESDFRFRVPIYDQTGELVGNTAEEWQNPPMVAATQYGTRERHLGKRVYVKLVDLGSLPNTSTKTVSYNTAQDAKAFSFEVFARASADDIIQSFPLARTSDGTITARANVTDYSVEVKTFADLSHYTGFAKIKYTKG